MFNTAFNDLLPVEKSKLDLYPNELRKDIDEVNDWVYNTVNSELLAASLKNHS
ncbi:S-glutathionyl-(chloro)hydroquinone reductase [Tulasnella sp. JGI-2019a]|nr:S-glutathionyl-(chloro)hydroquinone reductase [Tulasnella sp. JGI-2019a]